MKWSSGSCRPAVGRHVQTSAVGCTRQSGAVGCARQSGAVARQSGAAWRVGAEAWQSGRGSRALWSGRAFGCARQSGLAGQSGGLAEQGRRRSFWVFPLQLGGIIWFERGGMWISRHLVFAVAGKNPPQTMRGIKARMERCVGCTPLVRVWKAKRGGVWDAHRLIRIWKVKRDGVWVAHRLAGLWNDGAGGRGHKCPPPHPRFPLSLSFPLLLPPLPPFSALLAPSVFVTWRSTAGAFAV